MPGAFKFIYATSAALSFGEVLARTLMPNLAAIVLGFGIGLVGVDNFIGMGALLLLGMSIGMLIARLRNRRRSMAFPPDRLWWGLTNPKALPHWKGTLDSGNFVGGDVVTIRADEGYS